MSLSDITRVKKSKPFTWLDVVVTVILLAAVGLSAWLIYKAPPAAVRINSPSYSGEFRLDKDAVIELDTLTVVIADGCVWVRDSACRDKTCEHTGKISRAGQSIVCLPAEVVVTIVGSSDIVWEVG